MKGFTMLEMIFVMCVIALIFLLTLPNIQKKREIVNEKGCDALVEVVNSQILLYELEHGNGEVTMDDLIEEGLLKESQRACPNGKVISIHHNEASVD